MRWLKCLLSVGLLAACVSGRAQSAVCGVVAEGPERFEVASVRMVAPDETPPDGVTTTLSPPGATPFAAGNISLKILIQLAYELNGNQMMNMPEWLDKVGYDITASTEGGRGLSYKELQRPLQALLAERFHLKVHREMREMEGYSLVVGKGGVKFAESFSETKGGAATPLMSGREVKMTNMSMQVFAILLGKPVERPVVDRTGLKGCYDLDLKYSPLGKTNQDLPDVFTALQEQTGLKLEHGKVPAEVLVIDHVDQKPTEN